MNLRTKILVTLPSLLLLVACTEEPKPVVKKEVKPAEPVTAIAAVHQTYRQARGWAPDCLLLSVANLDVKDVKGQEGGKMAAWEVTFVSPSQRQSRRYTYSVVEVPASNLPEGVSGGSPDMWSPTGQSQPFAIQYLKTDSPAAYATAMTKAKEYAAKHPDMPVKFVVEWQKRHLNPTWRVYWGETVDQQQLWRVRGWDVRQVRRHGALRVWGGPPGARSRRAVSVAQALLPAASTFVSRPVFRVEKSLDAAD